MSQLSNDELEAYSRQIMLPEIGFEGQARLRRARVGLIGVGGIGTPLALQLTAMGVGFLRIVDRDVVSKSDLHRQYLYDHSCLGEAKVEAAARRLRALNPGVEIEPVALPAMPENIEKLLSDVDIIMDGLDRISSRYLVNRASVKMGKPYVFSAGIESTGTISTIIPRETPCLECFYGGLRDDQLPKCSVVGVHPSVLGMVGSIAVSEAVRYIVGKKPNLAGKLVYVDLDGPELQSIEIRRRADCPVCGDGVSPSYTDIVTEEIEVACGRDGSAVYYMNPQKPRPVGFDYLANRAAVRGFKVAKISELSLTLEGPDGLRLSILPSGYGVALKDPPFSEGDRDRILRLFNELTS